MDLRYLTLIEAVRAKDYPAFKHTFDELVIEKISEKLLARAAKIYRNTTDDGDNDE